MTPLEQACYRPAGRSAIFPPEHPEQGFRGLPGQQGRIIEEIVDRDLRWQLSDQRSWHEDQRRGDAEVAIAGAVGVVAITAGRTATARWAYQGSYGTILTNPILLGVTGGGANWTQMTLIAPGQVNGTLTIWARNNATGAIYSYPVSVDGNGLSTLNAANPGSQPTATSGQVITPAESSLTSTTYPAVASPGPLDNSSYPGLYAEDSSGNVWYYPGQSGSQPIGKTPVLVGQLNTQVTQLS